MNRTRVLWFKIFTVLVAPILFFVLVEVGLRVVGSGYNTDVFVEEDGIVRSNWPFTFKYFPWSMARPMQPLQFKAEKESGTLRIFVLGGSAAQGFPEEEFGMAGQLQVMLEQVYPDRKIDVINAAITAVNSHVVLPVAKACLDYDPDFLAVYVGNNEVVGPHGAGTVFTSFNKSLFLIRASDSVKSLRLYQLLVMLSGQHKSPTGTWKGMEFFLENTLYADDERLETVYSHFSTNLEDLIDAASEEACPVLLSTVGVNLLDNPPFASKEPYHAETEYRLGLKLIEEGKTEEASLAFKNARDWDGLRFRADENINKAIREVATEYSGKVTLIDSERRFEENDFSPVGVPGDALFYDHVHLSFSGNYAVARSMAEAVIEKTGSSPRPVPSQEGVASLLAFSKWDQLQIAKKLTEQLLNKAPFTNQWNHRNRQLSRKRETRKMIAEFGAEGMEESRRLYERSLDEKPEDPVLKRRLGRLLSDMGEQEPARTLLLEVVRDFPTNHEALMELSHMSAALADFDHAEENIRAILKLNPHAIEARNAYLKLLFDAERFEEAVRYNEALIEDHPADPDIRYVFALILNEQGRKRTALEQLEKAVTLDPKHKEARSLIVKTLRSRNDSADAIDAARAWTKADPDSSEAHSVLGELLSQKKDYKAAAEHYKHAIELDPDFLVARSRYVQSMVQQGLIFESIQFLAIQLKNDPDMLEGNSMLGVTLDVAGRKKEAMAIFRFGIQRDPNNLKCLRELAWILATAKSDQYRNGAEAAELAERLVKLAPNDPDFRNVLAAAYAETRQFDKAINAAKEGIGLATASQNQSQIELINTCLAAYERRQPLRSN